MPSRLLNSLTQTMINSKLHSLSQQRWQFPLHKGALKSALLSPSCVKEGFRLSKKSVNHKQKIKIKPSPLSKHWFNRFFTIPQSLRDSSLYTREPQNRTVKPSLCKGGWQPKADGRIVFWRNWINQHLLEGKVGCVATRMRCYTKNFLL